MAITLLVLPWLTAYTCVLGDLQGLALILYQPGSGYDDEVKADRAAGSLIGFQKPAGAPATYFGHPVPDPAGVTSPGTQNKPNTGPLCGEYCWGPVNLCTGDDGCKCIADPWQGTGSGYFTGSCKLPYSAQDSGRELNEVLLNSTSPIASSPAGEMEALPESTLACPCNCTYVSNACCLSASGVVFEAPGLKMGVLQPPDNSTFCNPATGKFQTRR